MNFTDGSIICSLTVVNLSAAVDMAADMVADTVEEVLAAAEGTAVVAVADMIPVTVWLHLEVASRLSTGRVSV